MSETKRSTSPIIQKINPALMAELRVKFRELEGNVTFRVRAIASQYPQFSESAMVEYGRVAMYGVDEAFQLYMDGKISTGLLIEFSYIEDLDRQKFVVEEALSRRFTRSKVAEIRRYINEGRGVGEAIGRASGEVTEPVDSPKPKSLIELMSEVARLGGRWRGLVSMAIEAADSMEGKFGSSNLKLFEDVYLLRHLIGEQYDFVNEKVKRYMNVLRKKVVDGSGSSALADADIQKGIEGD